MMQELIRHISEKPDEYGIVSTLITIILGFVDPQLTLEEGLDLYVLIMRAVGITLGTIVTAIALGFKLLQIYERATDKDS